MKSVVGERHSSLGVSSAGLCVKLLLAIGATSCRMSSFKLGKYRLSNWLSNVSIDSSSRES